MAEAGEGATTSERSQKERARERERKRERETNREMDDTPETVSDYYMSFACIVWSADCMSPFWHSIGVCSVVVNSVLSKMAEKLALFVVQRKDTCR